MAVESPIREAHNWFAGENKAFRFTITGDAPTIDGWSLQWTLHRRRVTAPIITKTTGGNGIVILDPTAKTVQVTVNAEDTINLDKTSYTYVLRRTDPGAEAVLAYGPAVLRRPEDT